jgi:hypothetical protein
MATFNIFCCRLTALKSETSQSRPAGLSKLCVIPRACRNGRLKRHLMFRQNWMASSLKHGLRPRLPVARPC